MKADNKTQANKDSVEAYLNGIADRAQQADTKELTKLVSQWTHTEAVMWGTAIIGFGTRHYKYESGREGDTMIIGLSARKQAIVVYGLGISDPDGATASLLEKLGPHDTGKGCLYIKSLAAIDQAVLQQMVTTAFHTV